MLVSFGDSHRAYGDAIARAIEGSRPHLDVYVTGTRALAAEVACLRPGLVISDLRKVGDASGWVEIPTKPSLVSRICVGGRCRRSRNSSFQELLSIVDETEDLHP